MTPNERANYQSRFAGKYFQHTDGGIYQFQHFAQSSEDSSKYYVVYLHVWPFEQYFWIRPVVEWVSRFAPISTERVSEIIADMNQQDKRAEITAKRTARKALASKETFNGESAI